MRICQVLPEFFMGGAEAMCITLSAELKNMGHDVCIVSLRTYESALSERACAYGISLYFMDKKPGLDFSCVPKLRKFLRSWKPDVIHTHMHATKYAFCAAIGLHLPICQTIHCEYNSAFKSFETRVNRFLYAHKKVVPVGLSDNIQRNISDFFRIPAQMCPIVPNGVDLSRCTPKESYALNGTARIVHVGSLRRVKNHKYIIDNIAALKDRGFAVQADFYGDGSQRAALEAQIAALKLTDCITLHGICANVFPELKKGDIFILPSLSEASPISIIEAMGTGLPIIASNVGGIPDMITDCENGLLISPDPESLANAVERLLKDEALRKTLGENAKKSAIRFSSVTMAEEYLKLYRKLVG